MRDRNLNSIQAADIQCITDLEKRLRDERTWKDRLADAIAGFVGSFSFVVSHMAFFALWFLANARIIPGVPPFDPYPFMFLSMAVSVEAVILSTFVLMKQNRMSKATDRRDALNLQISLLAERESTKSIEMLHTLCHHFGLHDVTDEETDELRRTTDVEFLARELKDKLPD